MADETLWDLTAETVMTAAHRLAVHDTSAATRAQHATFALLGGLEINNQTVTTTDVTGAVGQLYVCTIAGLTADRNLTLPSAQVGERVGVYIVDGDADYALVLKGAASQTINGGTAATEWSRVFIANEAVTFLCIAANTWIVETDMRIPCAVKIRPVTDTPASETSFTWTDIDLSGTTPDYDVGGIAVIASDHVLIRRTGMYQITMNARPLANVGDQNYYSLGYDTSAGNSTQESTVELWADSTTANHMSMSTQTEFTTADTLYLKYLSEQGSRGYDANSGYSRIIVQEILSR
jgi:hypothetical protein